MTDSPDKTYSVYIHFDFDDFDADQMSDMRKMKMTPGIFCISRMVPRGYFHYFFSYLHEEIDPSLNQVYTFVDNKATIMDVTSFDQNQIAKNYL